MRGELVLFTLLSLIAGVSAAVARGTTRQLSHWGSAEQGNATLVTYHKTGTVMVKRVHDGCFSGLGTEFDGQGHLSLPAVHFTRDPKAVVRSAYNYHKTSEEAWLLEPTLERSWLQSDPVVGPTYMANESYQEYLRRVPWATGVRAEFIRSSKFELPRMIENAKLCMANPDDCMQVCLESFVQSSESYRWTWSGVLNFLGLNQSYLDCIQEYDLLNPDHLGEVLTHVTSPLPGEVEAVYGLFAQLDSELMNNTFAEAAGVVGCIPAGQQLFQTTFAEPWRTDRVADMYA